MADGYVSFEKNTIELSLKESDKDHLRKINEYFLSNSPIKEKRKYDKRYDKTYISYRVCYNSKKIKDNLSKLGCTTQKSLTLKFPELEENIVPHFIRGYFDGDGCITKTSSGKIAIEILGTEEMLLGILSSSNINVKIHSFNHSSVKRIQMFGKNANHFLEYIYNNSSLFLDRKRNKVEQIAPYDWKLRK